MIRWLDERFLGKAPTIAKQNPSIGSITARARGAINPDTGVPRYVRVMSNHAGYPGDDAVWLGQAYAAFRVGRGRNTLLDNMSLKIKPDQLVDRRTLLKVFDTLDRTIDSGEVAQGMELLPARLSPSAS